MKRTLIVMSSTLALLGCASNTGAPVGATPQEFASNLASREFKFSMNDQIVAFSDRGGSDRVFGMVALTYVFAPFAEHCKAQHGSFIVSPSNRQEVRGRRLPTLLQCMSADGPIWKVDIAYQYLRSNYDHGNEWAYLKILPELSTAAQIDADERSKAATIARQEAARREAWLARYHSEFDNLATLDMIDDFVAAYEGNDPDRLVAKAEALRPALLQQRRDRGNALPLGLEIGVATCNTARKKLVRPTERLIGQDTWLETANPTSFYPDAVKVGVRCSVNRVIAVTIVVPTGGIGRPASREAYKVLASKYKIISGAPMPEVGEGYALFVTGNSIIEQDAPQVAHEFEINYYQKEFFDALQALHASERQRRSNKIESAL